MIYLKSILAGVAASLIAFLLFALGVVAVGGFVAWRQATASGVGGIGAVSIGFAAFLPEVLMVVAFVAGFWWQFRRTTRARRNVS